MIVQFVCQQFSILTYFDQRCQVSATPGPLFTHLRSESPSKPPQTWWKRGSAGGCDSKSPKKFACVDAGYWVLYQPLRRYLKRDWMIRGTTRTVAILAPSSRDTLSPERIRDLRWLPRLRDRAWAKCNFSLHGHGIKTWRAVEGKMSFAMLEVPPCYENPETRSQRVEEQHLNILCEKNRTQGWETARTRSNLPLWIKFVKAKNWVLCS